MSITAVVHREETEFGIDVKVVFGANDLIAHRIFVPRFDYDYATDTRSKPTVQIQPLGVTAGSADDIARYATQLLIVADLARDLQREADAAWQAKAVQP